jgi:hypothetical protein
MNWSDDIVALLAWWWHVIKVYELDCMPKDERLYPLQTIGNNPTKVNN